LELVLQASFHPFLYDITVILHAGQDPKEALNALDSELKQPQVRPVFEEEIARAVKQARALFAYGTKISPTRRFGWVCGNVCDVRWFVN
jgi:zinc protease